MRVWGIQHLHRCRPEVDDWVTWALYEDALAAVENLKGLAKEFDLGEPQPSKKHGGWLSEAKDTDIKIRAVPIDVVGVVADAEDAGKG